MHSVGLSGLNRNNNYYSLLDGHVAVCAFFILSGFWVSRSFCQSRDVKSYFIKRLRRIFPMYIAVVIGVAVVGVLFSSLSAKEYFFNSGFYKYIFWNLITLNFVHTYLPGCFDETPVNGALWTIKVELGFYIILPILFYILSRIKKQRNRNLFLISIYVLSVLYNIALKWISTKTHIPSQLSYQLPGMMSFFISGMLFFLNWQRLIRLCDYLVLPATVIFAFHYFSKTEIFMPFCLAIMIMWIGVKFKPLKRIGHPIDYSFGMYLFHFPIIKILCDLGFFDLSPFISVLLVITSSFTLSHIVERTIGQRFH